MMDNKNLWIDTRLSQEEMDFLNVIITPSIKRNAKVKEHETGNAFRDELIDKDNWFYETAIKKLSEKMFYRDWDNYHKYVVDEEESPPKFEMDKLWINFQKKHDFVYLHNHPGLYSFVIFMKIPTHWEEQHVCLFNPSGAGLVASDFMFAWAAKEQKKDGIFIREIKLNPEDEGRILFFPSWLRHQVYPFYGTDKERITISGNISLCDPNRLEMPEVFGDVYEEKKKMLKMMEESVKLMKEELKNMKKVA